MKNVVIYGGSFDPIHTGHIMIASRVAALPDVDEVWLMVSPENPFKTGRRMAPEGDRLAMARLATSSVEGVEACDFEFTLPRPSYTYNTLCRLSEACPDCDFRLLIGGDNWRDFAAWRNPVEILTRFGVIIYPRPGVSLPGLDMEAATPGGAAVSGEETHLFPIPLGARIFVVPDAPQSEASSTEIRRRIAAGLPTDGLLPSGVRDYIDSRRLYRGE